MTSQLSHRPQWISNFYIVRIYLSLGIFAAIFVLIHTSFMEIWKKMWMGVFFWTQCSFCIRPPHKNRICWVEAQTHRPIKRSKMAWVFTELNGSRFAPLMHMHLMPCQSARFTFLRTPVDVSWCSSMQIRPFCCVYRIHTLIIMLLRLIISRSVRPFVFSRPY